MTTLHEKIQQHFRVLQEDRERMERLDNEQRQQTWLYKVQHLQDTFGPEMVQVLQDEGPLVITDSGAIAFLYQGEYWKIIFEYRNVTIAYRHYRKQLSLWWVDEYGAMEGTSQEEMAGDLIRAMTQIIQARAAGHMADL